MVDSAASGFGNLDRYIRQIRYAPLGEAGQKRLAAGKVLVCGCGALGSMLANTLVRAGVGCVRIVDRDFVETNNLQRQMLFDEEDVAAQLPKAIAAAEKLRKINSAGRDRADRRRRQSTPTSSSSATASTRSSTAPTISRRGS